MQILCIDVGSGTQDILLLDTEQTLENAIQMVLPAPTVQIAQQIERATACSEAIVLIGETMGGGACAGALMKHLKAGYKAYATPKAAQSFDDNLEKVASWGVTLLSDEESLDLSLGTVIKMRDIDLNTLEQSLSIWGIDLNPDAIGVALLDHGAAPVNESQRTYRFRQLERLLRDNSTLESFIFTSNEVPSIFSRMLAVERSITRDTPLVLMDTGAAAVLGASLDRVVAAHPQRLVTNLGNSHTIAFLLEKRKVLGFFEHHTSALSQKRLESLLKKLMCGSISLEEVWDEGGHGSITLGSIESPLIAATGPRRMKLASSELKPYFAAPFGSMMLVGCFGLALGIAIKFPNWHSTIEKVLIHGTQDDLLDLQKG
jgi:uncharacterized protein (DUF1786 family)